MDYDEEGPQPSCADDRVDKEIRVKPSLMERLASRKLRLEAELSKVNEAIALLKAGTVSSAAYAVLKAADRY